MLKKLKIKSNNNLQAHNAFAIFGGTGLLLVSWYLANQGFKEDYPQIFWLILSFIFGVLGISSFVSFYTFNCIFVYEEHIEIKSIFGNTKKIILLNDITSWAEIEKEDEGAVWKELTIYHKNGKLKLSTTNYFNYTQLKKVLVLNKVRDTEKEKLSSQKYYKYFAIGSAAFGFLFLVGSIYIPITKKANVRYSDLEIINDVVAEKIKDEESYLQIKLSKYPSFTFTLSGSNYSAAKVGNLIANVHTGDTLSIQIMKDVFQTKLSKEKKLSFWSKTVNYPFIQMYDIKDNHRLYLKLSDYNREEKSDIPLAIIFYGGGALFFIGAAIYVWMNY